MIDSANRWATICCFSLAVCALTAIARARKADEVDAITLDACYVIARRLEDQNKEGRTGEVVNLSAEGGDSDGAAEGGNRE